jgi:SAM-dependent methyltransferase
MKNKRKEEWFDNDAFWRDTYPFMFPPKRFEDTPEQLKQVLALTKPKGKAVLDLCCGPGRFSIPLAKRKFKVTGVDRTKFLMDKAKARAIAEKVNIEWVFQDMRDFIRPNSFDLALSMFTSFGYFDNKSEDMLVLGNIFASLRPGGVFLIDIVSKEQLGKIFESTVSAVLPDKTRVVLCHEIIDNWTRTQNEWIFIKNGKAKSYKFHHTIYSGQELIDRMEKVGFVDIRLYGNLAGDKYGYGSQRLIAVGLKPKR